jgi:hypothetical protein
MHTTQRIIFGNIGASRPEKPQLSKEAIAYNSNCMIIEIANNFSIIEDLMREVRSGQKRNLDQMEREWLNFILEKNIRIYMYENAENFFQDNFIKITD